MALAGLDLDVIRSMRGSTSSNKAKNVPRRIPKMPLAERAADAELSRCRLLVEAVTFASKALAHAGGRLHNGAVGFRPADGGDASLADGCQCLVAACGGLGTSLTELGAMLAGEVLASLQEVEQSIEEVRSRRRPGLVALEQAEDNCKKNVMESKERHEKATEQLKTVMAERDEVDRRGGWFLKKTLSGKLTRQIDQAAQVQDKVVQELSQHMDQLAVAQQRNSQNVDAYQDIMVEADARLKKALSPLLLSCARAWKDTADAIRCGARTLQTNAAALVRENAGEHGTLRGQHVAQEYALDDDSSADGSPASHIAAQHGSSFSHAIGTAEDGSAEGPTRLNLHAERASKPPAATIGRSADARPTVDAMEAMSRQETPLRQDLKWARRDPGESTEAVEISTAREPGDIPDEGDDSVSEASSNSSDEDASEYVAAKSAEASGQNPQHLEYVAGASQGPLGLKISWPPGRVIVQQVVRDGWADNCGLQEGVEIVAINGEVAATMQEADLRDLLKSRPLSIAIYNTASFADEGAGPPAEAGVNRV